MVEDCWRRRLLLGGEVVPASRSRGTTRREKRFEDPGTPEARPKNVGSEAMLRKLVMLVRWDISCPR
jgi:hypothetical protein